MDRYPTTYSDVPGSETTSIFNDGETLRINLRGLEFSGTDFDSLEPPADAATEVLAQFRLHYGSLCSCRMEFVMPVTIVDQGRQVAGHLFVELVLGDATPSRGLDREDLRIVLQYDNERFLSSGKNGWFEDELLEIQAQLPSGVYMKACINCMYSDYSPYGHGLFGQMMCFRNLKDEYIRVRSKSDFFSLHDRLDRLVQETYLCPEFERRIPGIGYRG